MKVQTKIILLLFVAFCAFAAVASWRGLSEIDAEKRVFSARVEEKGRLFEEIIELKGAPLRSEITDYTFWDDMVSFVKSKDKIWALENIDPSLTTFKNNAVWVYDANYSFVYSVNNLKDSNLNTLPVPEGALAKLFAESRFCNFFIDTKNGIMEIYGATIHPTNDPERKTPPRGYFFVGIVWDTSYVAAIAKIFEGEVALVRDRAAVPRQSDRLAQGTIHFRRILKDWDGAPLAYADVESRSEALKILSQEFKKQLLVFAAFVLVVLVVIFVALLYLVNRPLRLITKSLDEEDANAIDSLKGDKTEYGRIAELMGIFFKQKANLEGEIAVRKLVEEQLKYSKEQMEVVYRLIPSAIFTVDMNRKITSWNDKAAELTGYSAEEAVGKECTMFSAFPCREKCGLYSDDVKKSVVGEQCTIQTKDGKELVVSKNVDFLRDPDGNVIGGIESFEDITERIQAKKKLEEWSLMLEDRVRERTDELKKSQEKLMHAEKLALIGQLASTVSHELRSPLTIIKNSAYFIKMIGPEGSREKLDEHIILINREVDACTQVIGNILGFVRPKKPSCSEWQLQAIIEESIQISVVPPEIKVTTHYQEGMPSVSVDSLQIRQVFNNMIKNAVDAMGNSGELTITLKMDDKYAIVEFKDTGVGIPSENLEKIFEPLFSTTPKGTGLGLSVCRQIVEDHNGVIEVESQPGKGTVFRIKLPVT